MGACGTDASDDVLQAPAVGAAEAVTVAAAVQYDSAADMTVLLTYTGLLQYLSCPTTSAGQCDSNGACVEARDCNDLICVACYGFWRLHTVVFPQSKAA